MPSRIVFVASLAHSGSTLTDLVLGAHPSMVSLGEIESSIRRVGETQRDCTCGHAAVECEVWGPVLSELTTRTVPYRDAYRLVMESVDRVYGPEITVVDSSKYLTPMRAVWQDYADRCHVVFLVRDVRGYMASHRRLYRRRGYRRVLREIGLWTGGEWYWKNRQLQNALRNEQIRHTQLGYEELCFQPEAALRWLCDRLGIEYSSEMLRPGSSTSHIIRGNEMRYNERALAAITYDSRWLQDRGISGAQWLLLPVLGWNARNVYQNVGR